LSPVPGSKPLQDDQKLTSYELRDNSSVYFKDLGAQIDYRLVFIIEYMGPILLWIFGYIGWRLYSGGTEKNYIQNLLTVMWISHFVKRELETLFIHEFSHGTMPLFPNLPRNCAHYWGAALYISFFILSPSFEGSSTSTAHIMLVFWIIFELANYYCHIILKNLRPPGTKVRAIPRGFFVRSSNLSKLYNRNWSMDMLLYCCRKPFFSVDIHFCWCNSDVVLGITKTQELQKRISKLSKRKEGYDTIYSIKVYKDI